MATMNKTFSVKTGLDLANTIILDSNRNISNVNIANVHTVNANSIVTVGGLNVVDQANTARNTANDAYAQANTARDTANDAYGQANTARATANDSYGQANAAYTQANSARDQANTAYGQANAAYGQANSAYGQANLAYAEANISANTVSVTVGGLTLDNRKIKIANTSTISIELLDDGTYANLVINSTGGIAYDQANAAYAQANVARTTANDAYGQANTARATANDSYAQANTARDTANDAYGQANTARTVGNNAYAQANTGYAQANAAYGQANTARTTANDAYGQANTARTTANDAYEQANTARATANDAYGQANAAYAEANSKLDLSGGVVVGDVTIDGNLYVNGVQTVVNTQSLTINDPIFLLGNNNITNSVGLGFTAHYGPTQQHTGLIRAHQDNIWYLFEDYDDHILYANNVLDTGNIKLATLRANINANSLLLLGNTVATQANLTLAHDQANAAYGQANTGRATANDAYAQANTARNTANDSYAQANTARDTANDAYGQANTARNTANDSYAQANTARDTANDAYGQANAGYAQANAAYGQANAAYLQANTAYGQANAAYSQANTGYAQANAAYGQANAAYVQANAAYSQANVAANTVRIYANSAGALSNKFLNFVNTASIQVSVSDNGDGNANITFATTGAAVADAYAQANAAYSQANAAYDEANTKVEEVKTGLGLANSESTIANVKTVTITSNIASTSVQGITKLIDSITSTDTANAATANAVNWLESKKVDRSGDTMTGKLTIATAGEGLEVANANISYQLTVEALKVTTNTVTTSVSGQVILDEFPTQQLASAKYFVQANSGSTYQTTEIVLVHEGTNIWMTEYGTIQTGASLGTFSADIDSGNVRLLFNATQSINTVRAIRYGIVP